MKNNRTRLLTGIARILGFLAIVGVFCYILRGQDWSVLQALNWQTLVLASALIVLSYVASGVQYYASLRIIGCTLTPFDVFFFPYMQSLWGVLIPIQGTSVFALFYLKRRYSFQMTQSVAMILFLYLFNVIFGGLAGMVYVFCAETFSTMLFVFSLAGILSPLFLYLFNMLLLKYGGALPVPGRIRDAIITFFQSFDLLFKDIRTLVVLLLLHVLHQLCRTLVFVILAKPLEPNAGFLWGYLVTVSQEISLILRFTPGNLGVAQAVSGFVSHFTGIPMSIGLIVALIDSLLVLIQVFVLGGTGCFLALRKDAGMKTLWSQAKNANPPEGGDDDPPKACL